MMKKSWNFHPNLLQVVSEAVKRDYSGASKEVQTMNSPRGIKRGRFEDDDKKLRKEQEDAGWI